MVTPAQVWQALKQVNDPEFPLSIVDLGMIYDVAIEASGQVNIEMTFTSIGCPAIDMIIFDVNESVKNLGGISNVNIDVVWSPPWTKEKITAAGREILQYHGVVN